MKKNKVHIIWAIVAVIALAGGFFWGKSSVPATGGRGSFAAGNFSSSTRARFGGATGGGFTTGEITSMSSDSLTLQLANGNSEVVFYSSSTAISKPTTVPASELSTGSNVMVAGTTNSDGSLTAQSIQVRTGTQGGPGGNSPSTSAQ